MNLDITLKNHDLQLHQLDYFFCQARVSAHLVYALLRTGETKLVGSAKNQETGNSMAKSLNDQMIEQRKALKAMNEAMIEASTASPYPDWSTF